MKKIIVSGGNGKFAQQLVEQNIEYEMVALDNSKLDVADLTNVENVVDDVRPDIFIHSGAFARPMALHNDFPDRSIRSNIIGTSNVVLACLKRNIKLVYISTDFVYPGTKGNYKEIDGVFPVNKYAWSKLGGECAVQLYDNSLILRISMCEYPYPHSKVFGDLKKSTIYNTDAAKIVLDLLDETGIINVGGDSMFLYDFVKRKKTEIEKNSIYDNHEVEMPSDVSMNCEKMKELL